MTTTMATTNGSIPETGNDREITIPNDHTRKGNLQALLTSYNENNNNNESSSLAGLDGNGPSDISIQLDVLGRERSSTLGSFRDRGLTFDSEFDLGLGFPDAGGHQEGDIDFGDTSQQQQQHQQRVNGNIVSANSSSASGKVASQGMRTRSRSRQLDEPTNAGPTLNGQQSSGFATGEFGASNAGGKSDTLLYGHTPPSAVATSYEGKHFGKRLRSSSFSSISGRLRSMSDLEDRGIIDRHQKGVLKDLIISGDDALQKAIDKYEGGDTSALESMIKSGALQTKTSTDIDLLGDLDLDFLSMKSDFGNDVPQHVASKAIPIPGRNRSTSTNNPLLSRSSTPSVRGQSPAPMDQNAYDGIGELDFNAVYGSSTVQTTSNTNTTEQAPQTHKVRADSIVDLYRSRANSLAFGVLLDEPGAVENDPVGKWMDRTPANGSGNIPEESKPLKKRASSHVVGANGGFYIVNDPTANKSQTDTSKMTKAEIAAMKRKEREEKKALREAEKALREAEKLAKREKKQREAQLKKANKASKSERKYKKSDGAKKKKDEASNSDDEPAVVVSGTGRPRSLSDPNLTIGLDENGLMHVEGPPDWVGAYSPESRKIRIERFLAKRNHRVWVKKVKYDVRKNFADSRLRVKGRFVKKEDEMLMRDLMSLT